MDQSVPKAEAVGQRGPWSITTGSSSVTSSSSPGRAGFRLAYLESSDAEDLRLVVVEVAADGKATLVGYVEQGE